jgi:predicted amidohydrolase
VRCTGKLLKIKSKLILIPFTFFVEYFYFLVVQNVVSKIDKETLRIGFRINPTFWFKKITNKVFTIG